MQRQNGERFFSSPKVKRLVGLLLISVFVLPSLATLFIPSSTVFAQVRDPEGLRADTRPDETNAEAGQRHAEEEGAELRTVEPPASSDVCGAGNIQGLEWVTCSVFLIFTYILERIAYLLGRLVIMMISVLLAFASYNGFADAAPVQMGWKLVRDVVNMFFIVVILASAFSTIIGYWDDFNYKKVLPKLLVMAVLINFSKTLIQLLIDFSQVLMLTFINAFRDAGAGNFAEALGLMDMLRLPEPSSENGTGIAGQEIVRNQDPSSMVNLTNIILALMLGIFMLCISLAVIIILTAYLIFRIVALWIALIFSPIAFFATALPDRLKRGLDNFTGKYWSQLVGLLTGGPIVAFFLWLTLATVQNTSQAGQGLAPGLNLGGDDVFLINSGVGNSNAIASFIVGISMMMLGLQAAVSSANAMGSATLSAFTNKIQGAGFSLGRLAALSPLLLGGMAAKGAGRYVDRRADITGRASKLGLQATRYMPDFINRAVRPTLMKGAVMRSKEAEKEGKEEAGLYADLQKYGGQDLAQIVAQNYGGPGRLKSLADERKSSDVSAMAASDDTADKALKERMLKMDQSKELDTRATAMVGSGAVATVEEGKAAIEMLERQKIAENQKGFLGNQLQHATARGDAFEVDRLKKLMTSHAGLAPDADQSKYLDKLAIGTPETLKDVDKYTAYNGRVLTELMKRNGWTEDPTTGHLTQSDKAAWDRYKKNIEKSGNQELLEGAKSHELLVSASPTQTANTFRNIQHIKNKKDGSIRAFTNRGGSVVTGVTPAGVPTTRTVEAGSRFRNDKQQVALDTLKTDALAAGVGHTPSSVDMSNALKAGASFSDLQAHTPGAADTIQAMSDNIAQVSTNDATLILAARTPAGTINEAAYNEAMQKLAPIFRQIDNVDATSDVQVKIALALKRGGFENILSKDGYSAAPKDMRKDLLKTTKVIGEVVNDIRQANPATLTPGQNELMNWYRELERNAEQRTSDLSSQVRSLIRRGE